ncbi:MAG TPA: polysaccharide deacetylase family protein [Candidatus Competibacteraceae bacterium]|nr:polysaccharide deacetylase family protein [Candidatus Competibacteraceae bacterium]
MCAAEAVTSARAAGKRALAAALRLSGIVARRRQRPGLVILMLHKVNDRPDPLPLTLAPALLAAVLAEIRRHHEVLDLAQLEDMPEGQGLCFALTFDDGYRDNYEQAFPLLRRCRVPATIFLSLDHINGRRRFWYEHLAALLEGSAQPLLELSDAGLGRHPLSSAAERRATLWHLNQRLKDFSDAEREALLARCAQRLDVTAPSRVSPMLDWAMIAEMAAAGVSFGSHTLSHPILSRESPERVREEVWQSKAELESRLGQPVRTFAYPNGGPADYTAAVVAEVRAAGYRLACTTVPGINDRSTDPFQLRRINLHNGMCSDAQGRFLPDLFWAKTLNLM